MFINIYTVLSSCSITTPFLTLSVCAARVTVVGPVCVSVTQHLTSRMSNRAIKKHIHTKWHTIIKNIVGIFLK